MRKALIIGIGGTGVEIANWLAERLRWEYDDLDRVSFVDFYCIDTSTDKISQSQSLNNSNHFCHATIPEKTFNQMRDNPEDFDSQSMFSRWYNPDVMHIQNAVEDGTTGLRMLGRMALLLPTNWNRIYDTISDKISDLVARTPEEAQQRLGRRFDDSVQPISFPDRVYVYVVATGCGGTGSGTFIEMGYLLRQLKQERYPDTLSTIGILSLPSAAEEHHERKANAYATLVELNHFSTDYNEYRDKYPNIPQPVHVYNYPYDFPYLVTVDSRAEQGGLRDYNELNYTIAQYIYSDVMFDVAAVRDGRRNNVTRHFISADKRGLSQRFMTFGVSFIQYPVERVMRGCTYKLLAQSFEHWLSDHRAVVPAKPAQILHLDSDSVYNRLIQSTGGSLEERLQQNIQNIQETYASVEDIHELQGYFQLAFAELESKQPPTSGFPELLPGVIPFAIELNRGPATAEFEERLRKHIEDTLFDINRGPSYCRVFLRKLRDDLHSRHRDQVVLDSSVKDRLFDVLQNVSEDFLLRFPLPLSRNVERHYLEHWCDAAEIYYIQRLHQACLSVEKRLCQDLEQIIDLISERLENVEPYLRTGQKLFQDRWEDQDRSFNINGILLFTPGSTNGDHEIRKQATITKEYENQLKARPEFGGLAASDAETAAMLQVIASLKTVAVNPSAERSDLFALPGRSFFDVDDSTRLEKYKVFRPSDEVLCINNTKRFFVGIKNINVVAAFQREYGAGQRLPALERAFTLSNWFLPLNANAPDFDDHPEKRYRWVFYRGATEQTAGADLESFQGDVRRLVGGTAEIREMDSDPHTVIFLSEYGAFPMRIIGSIADWRQYYEAAMGLVRNGNDNRPPVFDPHSREVPTLFNREDVVWVAFEEADRDRLFLAEEFFLLGLAFEDIERATQGSGFVFQATEVRGDSLAFDTDLRRSARQLYGSPNYMTALSNRIHRRRHGGENDKVIISTLYNEFLGGRLQTLGLTGIPGKDEAKRREYVRSVFNRFIARDQYLRTAYHEIFKPRMDFAHLFRHKDAPIDETDPSQGAYPADGFYCEKCHQFFGETQENIPDVCWKPTCRWLYYVT